jgi:hypothetical protein
MWIEVLGVKVCFQCKKAFDDDSDGSVCLECRNKLRGFHNPNQVSIDVDKSSSVIRKNVLPYFLN